MCLTDEQTGELLATFDEGERERDRKLCWLRAWFGYDPCPAPD